MTDNNEESLERDRKSRVHDELKRSLSNCKADKAVPGTHRTFMASPESPCCDLREDAAGARRCRRGCAMDGGRDRVDVSTIESTKPNFRSSRATPAVIYTMQE